MFFGEKKYMYLNASPVQFFCQAQNMGFNSSQTEGTM